MRLLGLKLTHDGGLSIADDNELILSWELEKFNNNNRFKILDDLEVLEQLIDKTGYKIDDFDRIIVDGWIGENVGQVPLRKGLKSEYLKVAPYLNRGDSIGQPIKFSGLDLFNRNLRYESYSHLFNHLSCAYMTSPFSRNNENSYVLIWDGGMLPSLFFFDGKTGQYKFLSTLFSFGVNVYSIFAQHFGPFKKNPNVIKDELSIAGKVMAYCGYGQYSIGVMKFLKQAYQELKENMVGIPDLPYVFTRIFSKAIKSEAFSDEDVLTTFHFFVEDMLVSSLQYVISENHRICENLCYAGGAALNIKWNSALRSKLGMKVWVPPFPNDSGSSIGALCSAIRTYTQQSTLKWNVYAGPDIVGTEMKKVPDNWLSLEYSLASLAKILFYLQKPIVFLNGKAEIGPRALGNRSILACATTTEMKSKINQIKFRENYRPIAPVCLEEYAELVFNPGSKDPYMLFDHEVRPEWLHKIPSAIHIDKSSRLQTVNKDENPELYKLIAEYYRLSNIPLLLNTSANYKGSGFFPDVLSAIKWGKIGFIWSGGTLFYHKRNIGVLESLNKVQEISAL